MGATKPLKQVAEELSKKIDKPAKEIMNMGLLEVMNLCKKYDIKLR